MALVIRARWIAVLLLALPALAQTQDNAPQPVDSYLDGATMNGGAGSCAGNAACVNFPEGVKNNDLIVCASGQEDNADGCTSTNPPWTFSDSIGFTWNTQTAGHVNSAQAPTWIQMSYACASSSSSTFYAQRTGLSGTCAGGMSCARFKNACSGGSITKDAFISQVYTTNTTQPFNALSNTLTTTRLNDLIVTATIKDNGSSSNNTTPTGTLSVATNDTGSWANLNWQIASALGSNTFTTDDINTKSRDAMQTIALQIPINLGDSALPQAASGTSYSAQLHCYGGTSATPTYNLVSGSLPSGLALTGATGVISGTTTAVGTSTLGFQCTDGTNTSATDTLTLVVNTSFATPSQVSTQSGNFSGGGGTATFNTTQCGDLISIWALGDDTHGGTGYLQTINGSGDYVRSDDGSTVQRYLLDGGTAGTPLVEYVIGPIRQAGTRIISVFNSTNASSALTYWASLIRGAQAVLDNPGLNGITGTVNGGTLAGSYTTVVPNEYVQVGTIAAHTTGAPNNETLALSPPFTTDTTGYAGVYDAFIFGHDLVASASTVTATTTFSAGSSPNCNGADWCQGQSTLITALRPGTATPSCAVPNFPGEKQRRRVY